jgi:hypothetical protein
MSEQGVFDALKYRIEVDARGTRRYYNAAGQKHREHGPAAIWADGSKFWYQNGQLHREIGPAIEWWNGSVEWWLNGVQLTESEFNQAIKE